MITPWQCFKKQFRRDFLIQIRQPRLLINATLFFLMVIVFFPLTIPPSKAVLRELAPGLVWMAVLLSTMLATERLFQQDYEDGIIEQWLISPASLRLIITAKLTIHWLLIIIPLLIFSPFLAILFDLSFHTTLVLITSLILGTPAILCLCALAAAFSSGMQQKGAFMALILLPLTIPVMIFGSGSLAVSMKNAPVSGHLALLLSISIICTAFLPFAIAAIIRIGLAD